MPHLESCQCRKRPTAQPVPYLIFIVDIFACRILDRLTLIENLVTSSIMPLRLRRGLELRTMIAATSQLPRVPRAEISHEAESQPSSAGADNSAPAGELAGSVAVHLSEKGLLCGKKWLRVVAEASRRVQVPGCREDGRDRRRRLTRGCPDVSSSSGPAARAMRQRQRQREAGAD